MVHEPLLDSPFLLKDCDIDFFVSESPITGDPSIDFKSHSRSYVIQGEMLRFYLVLKIKDSGLCYESTASVRASSLAVEASFQDPESASRPPTILESRFAIPLDTVPVKSAPQRNEDQVLSPHPSASLATVSRHSLYHFPGTNAVAILLEAPVGFKAGGVEADVELCCLVRGAAAHHSLWTPVSDREALDVILPGYERPMPDGEPASLRKSVLLRAVHPLGVALVPFPYPTPSLSGSTPRACLDVLCANLNSAGRTSDSVAITVDALDIHSTQQAAGLVASLFLPPSLADAAGAADSALAHGLPKRLLPGDESAFLFMLHSNTIPSPASAPTGPALQSPALSVAFAPSGAPGDMPVFPTVATPSAALAEVVGAPSLTAAASTAAALLRPPPVRGLPVAPVAQPTPAATQPAIPATGPGTMPANAGAAPTASVVAEALPAGPRVQPLPLDCLAYPDHAPLVASTLLVDGAPLRFLSTAAAAAAAATATTPGSATVAAIGAGGAAQATLGGGFVPGVPVLPALHGGAGAALGIEAAGNGGGRMGSPGIYSTASSVPLLGGGGSAASLGASATSLPYGGSAVSPQRAGSVASMPCGGLTNFFAQAGLSSSLALSPAVSALSAAASNATPPAFVLPPPGGPLATALVDAALPCLVDVWWSAPCLGAPCAQLRSQFACVVPVPPPSQFAISTRVPPVVAANRVFDVVVCVTHQAPTIAPNFARTPEADLLLLVAPPYIELGARSLAATASPLPILWPQPPVFSAVPVALPSAPPPGRDPEAPCGPWCLPTAPPSTIMPAAISSPSPSGVSGTCRPDVAITSVATSAGAVAGKGVSPPPAKGSGASNATSAPAAPAAPASGRAGTPPAAVSGMPLPDVRLPSTAERQQTLAPLPVSPDEAPPAFDVSRVPPPPPPALTGCGSPVRMGPPLHHTTFRGAATLHAFSPDEAAALWRDGLLPPGRLPAPCAVTPNASTAPGSAASATGKPMTGAALPPPPPSLQRAQPLGRAPPPPARRATAGRAVSVTRMPGLRVLLTSADAFTARRPGGDVPASAPAPPSTPAPAFAPSPLPVAAIASPAQATATAATVATSSVVAATTPAAAATPGTAPTMRPPMAKPPPPPPPPPVRRSPSLASLTPTPYPGVSAARGIPATPSRTPSVPPLTPSPPPAPPASLPTASSIQHTAPTHPTPAPSDRTETPRSDSTSSAAPVTTSIISSASSQGPASGVLTTPATPVTPATPLSVPSPAGGSAGPQLRGSSDGAATGTPSDDSPLAASSAPNAVSPAAAASAAETTPSPSDADTPIAGEPAPEASPPPPRADDREACYPADSAGGSDRHAEDGASTTAPAAAPLERAQGSAEAVRVEQPLDGRRGENAAEHRASVRTVLITALHLPGEGRRREVRHLLVVCIDQRLLPPHAWIHLSAVGGAWRHLATSATADPVTVAGVAAVAVRPTAADPSASSSSSSFSSVLATASPSSDATTAAAALPVAQPASAAPQAAPPVAPPSALLPPVPPVRPAPALFHRRHHSDDPAVCAAGADSDSAPCADIPPASEQQPGGPASTTATAAPTEAAATASLPVRRRRRAGSPVPRVRPYEEAAREMEARLAGLSPASTAEVDVDAALLGDWGDPRQNQPVVCLHKTVHVGHVAASFSATVNVQFVAVRPGLLPLGQFVLFDRATRTFYRQSVLAPPVCVLAVDEAAATLSAPPQGGAGMGAGVPACDATKKRLANLALLS